MPGKRPQPKFVYYVLPTAGAMAVVFGIVYGWVGINALVHGGGWVAGVLIVFGFAGVTLGLALWRAWRMVGRRSPGA